MKSNSSFLLAQILAAGAVFVSALSVINAQTLQQAPDNPAFIQYQQERTQKAATAKTVSGHGHGYIPSPVDLSYLRGRTPAHIRTLQALPATYDLRTLGKLTPIKNQGNYGTCWAFATYSSLESTLMPTEERYFSVNNLVNNHGFDCGYDEGGTYPMSTAYLTRWSGPINEVDDPYPNPGHSPSNLTVQKHVQEVLILPGKASALDNTAIKQAVINYGAVCVSMYADFNTNYYYNSTTFSFYYNGTSNSDHAVAIVGWDDNYSAANFLQTPAGNGAFIVRNSWGTNWVNKGSDNGYFYCSYYDSKMAGEENAVFNNAESATNYGSIYQYDPLGRVSDYGYGSTNAWAANIFTATNNETLRAVGFYATDIDVNYEIYIYANLTAGNPRSGTLKLTQTGACAYAGYHTVALNTPVTVSSGQLFSVVIQFVNSSYTYPIAYEYARSNYSSRATSSPGQSYVSHYGTSWSDLTTYDSTANVCIKAFCGTGGLAPSVASAVADYDGDGKADPAIYDETTGTWKVKLSSANYYLLTTTLNGLGGIGRASVSADYDGDRLADPAVYLESTGRWVILPSTANYSTAIALTQTLGGAGYTGIPADYDGDRLADPAVYQSVQGDWKVFLSSANYYLIESPGLLGGIGYRAVAADYDGDRLADPAVYGESNGYWIFRLSSIGYLEIALTRTLGGINYLPVPADYDGDGLADPAVKSVSGNEWIVMLSTGGYVPVHLTLLFE
ncbi:MAG: lectin like domain-containing protein [Kiritimatiellia bacterium]|nr:lectin like domain-containing protein [Kiritimatiellia bacterium]